LSVVEKTNSRSEKKGDSISSPPYTLTTVSVG
jgi:hypothetical protein